MFYHSRRYRLNITDAAVSKVYCREPIGELRLSFDARPITVQGFPRRDRREGRSECFYNRGPMAISTVVLLLCCSAALSK